MARETDIEDLLYWAFREQKVETLRNPTDDALTIYWAVMALPDPHGHLVKHHARIGRPPDWRAGSDRKVVHLSAARHWRERYTQWHAALTILSQTLNGSLRGHAACGPAALERPWQAGPTLLSGTARRAR
jgi:hypothetical protein